MNLFVDSSFTPHIVPRMDGIPANIIESNAGLISSSFFLVSSAIVKKIALNSDLSPSIMDKKLAFWYGAC